jgi:hypothetical protein
MVADLAGALRRRKDMAVKGGRVVKTPGKKKPYKVVLERENREETEHAVETVREGEELIRDEVVTPPEEPKSDSWNP